MNIAMKLTFDGLVRALRLWRLALREELALESFRQNEGSDTSGEHYDERRGRITKGPV